ncbi:SDR family NAD(P)-dependent oxidoreductase [Paenibacillus macerans]|uniref:SDR family NAD(P)-dependent oxidoreductase n=1 Tax=Paenibacillus macerans TaxID=44252 RepID=UPI003D31C0EE
MDLTDKVAVVTGGSRGIGRATAIMLAKRGAKVVVHDMTDAACAEEVAAYIREEGGEALAVQGDMCDADEMGRIIDNAAKKFGSVDILVMSANLPFARKPFAEMAWAEFAQKLNDEMRAAFVTTQAVIPGMIKRRSGRLIYVSSTLGKDPSPHMIALGTAKGSLDTFAAYIAQEFGTYGITANVVAPGLVQADEAAELTEQEMSVIGSFTPLGRVAVPEDVAGVISFLAGGDAGFVTGTYTPVTGGLVME